MGVGPGDPEQFDIVLFNLGLDFFSASLLVF
jgi:hypothetical protein